MPRRMFDEQTVRCEAQQNDAMMHMHSKTVVKRVVFAI